LAGTAGLATGVATPWGLALLGCAVLSLVTPLRRLALAMVVAATAPIARAVDDRPAAGFLHLGDLRTWNTALATSIAAWLLPCAGLWLLARQPLHSLSVVEAVNAYAGSATASVLSLAPGGILIACRQMLAAL